MNATQLASTIVKIAALMSLVYSSYPSAITCRWYAPANARHSSPITQYASRNAQIGMARVTVS